jgi:predicted nucleic acid-binding protein
MSIVVDASVALKWVVDEPGTAAALAIRSEQLVAPAIWLTEVANALWRHVRIGEASPAEALARMARLGRAPVLSLPIEPHVSTALELAIRGNHPVYDCLYLAVAIQRDTQVLTDDRRFADAATRLGLGERVRLLGS